MMPGEKLRHGHIQSTRKPVNALQRNISRAAFDIGNVSAMQPRSSSQFLLGNPQATPPLPNRSAEEFFYLIPSHGFALAFHTITQIETTDYR